MPVLIEQNLEYEGLWVNERSHMTDYRRANDITTHQVKSRSLSVSIGDDYH